MFDTPILLIVWRRSEIIQNILEVLSSLEPSNIFVSCDGPRSEKDNDQLEIDNVCAIIRQEIIWECSLKIRKHKSNLGCSLGPVSAINWFFTHVKEGIILEDDCIPHPDFFRFCSYNLAKYRTDDRIWCISGSQFHRDRVNHHESYYFTTIPTTWGWATWERCWKYYDVDLLKWPRVLQSPDQMANILPNRAHRRYWTNIWEKTYQNRYRTWWDYQWAFLCVINSGLTVTPNKNLVLNIGFDCHATHTHQRVSMPNTEPLGSIKDPELIVPNREEDHKLFISLFDGIWYMWPLHYLTLFRRMYLRIQRDKRRLFN